MRRFVRRLWVLELLQASEHLRLLIILGVVEVLKWRSLEVVELCVDFPFLAMK